MADSDTNPTAAADALSGAGMNPLAVSNYQSAMGRRVAAEKEEGAIDKAIAAEGERQKQDWQKLGPPPKAPDLKPWTEKPPEVDPARSFGSVASLVGILFSAFTRTPMTSALNASAAAMRAQRTADLDAYQKAHQAWKDNTELAMKNAEWELRGYEVGMRQLEVNHNEGWAAIRTMAAQTQNKAVMAMADAGNALQFGRTIDSMRIAHQKAAEDTARFGIELEGHELDVAEAPTTWEDWRKKNLSSPLAGLSWQQLRDRAKEGDPASRQMLGAMTALSGQNRAEKMKAEELRQALELRRAEKANAPLPPATRLKYNTAIGEDRAAIGRLDSLIQRVDDLGTGFFAHKEAEIGRFAASHGLHANPEHANLEDDLKSTGSQLGSVRLKSLYDSMMVGLDPSLGKNEVLNRLTSIRAKIEGDMQATQNALDAAGGGGVPGGEALPPGYPSDARKAPDGNYYVERDGTYYRVDK